MPGVIIRGGTVTYWAEHAGVATRADITLQDGTFHQFELPAERRALDVAIAVLASGITIGRWEKANELRAVFGSRPISDPKRVP